MPVMWSPDSEFAKERRRWETQHSEFGPPGRVFEQREWPLMVYRASRPSTGGKTPILEHYIVADEQEERNMRSRGFVRGPDHAIEMLEASERDLATAAAERAYQDRLMSDRAKAEAAAVDETTISHLGAIPETPIHKKGWPKGKPRKQVNRE